MAETKQRKGRRKSRRTFGATRQLPSGRWQASYLGSDGKRRKANSTFATAADADAWLNLRSAEMTKGEWRAPEPGRETFGQYGARWLAHRVDLRPSTRELYEILWRVWLEPSFGDVQLAKMTPGAWRTWFVEQTAKHPGSTQPGKAYRLARAMLNTAVEDDLLPSNPCRVKGAGKDTAGERPTASPEQVARIARGHQLEVRPHGRTRRLSGPPVRRTGGPTASTGRPTSRDHYRRGECRRACGWTGRVRTAEDGCR